MRKHGKVDTTQAAIVDALLGAGASVKSTASLGDGFVDLVVGFRGQNYLIEAKSPGGKLTQLEQFWHGGWRGHADVVYSPDEALKVIGAA